MDGQRTLVIVDDHPFFREGLKSLLSHHPRFRVVGEAGSAEQGLRVAKELQPDIVVMDISLPDGSGIDVAREIRTRFPRIGVVILSMHSRIDYITKAFEAGATGYVTKDSATERFVECLETVTKGDYYMDASLSRSLVHNLMKSARQEPRIADAGYSKLTAREQEIMRLLAEGHSAKQIAENLFISPKTVENHRANIMAKLDLHSAMDLVRYAAKLGLIDVDLWKG